MFTLFGLSQGLSKFLNFKYLLYIYMLDVFYKNALYQLSQQLYLF